MARNTFPSPPEFWTGASEELQRKTSLAVRGLLQGKSNNLKNVTLRTGQTTTVVTDSRITPDTLPFLIACSATAAAATGVWTTSSAGSLTINHDSDAATDRTFGLVLFG